MAAYTPLVALFTLAPSLRRASSRALSVYLPARAEGFDTRFYDIEIGDLIHRYKDRMTEKDRALMDYDSPPGLTSRSCGQPVAPRSHASPTKAARVLQVVKLRSETDERLEVGQLLDRAHPPTVRAVAAGADRRRRQERAKTFGAILDTILVLDHVEGAEVRKSLAGGSSAQSNQRKADNTAKANLETAVRTVEREMASGAYQNLFVAGPAEAAATSKPRSRSAEAKARRPAQRCYGLAHPGPRPARATQARSPAG